MCGVHNIQFVPIFKRYVLESALLIAISKADLFLIYNQTYTFYIVNLFRKKSTKRTPIHQPILGK